MLKIGAQGGVEHRFPGEPSEHEIPPNFAQLASQSVPTLAGTLFGAENGVCVHFFGLLGNALSENSRSQA